MRMSPELVINLLRRCQFITHPGPDPEGGVVWICGRGLRHEWCYGTYSVGPCPPKELSKQLHSKCRRGDDWSRLRAKQIAIAIETIRATPRG